MSEEYMWFNCVKRSDTYYMEQILLSNKSIINRRDKQDLTAVIRATMNNDRGMLEFLIKNGADLDLRDSCGNTALMYASSYGYLLILDFLIENGADISITDDRGRTCLYDAAREGNTRICAYLANKGLVFEAIKDPNYKYIDKETHDYLQGFEGYFEYRRMNE